MPRLTADMRRVIDEQRLAFVATVTADGRPNVSPKGTIAVWDDDTLVFADLASPGTVRNLETRPEVELNVVDPFVRKGYRFRGRAELLRKGTRFTHAVTWYGTRGVVRPAERIRTIVLVHLTTAEAVVSPGYDVGATEAELRRSWRAHYDALHGLTAGGPAIWE